MSFFSFYVQKREKANALPFAAYSLPAGRLLEVSVLQEASSRFQKGQLSIKFLCLIKPRSQRMCAAAGIKELF